MALESAERAERRGRALIRGGVVDLRVLKAVLRSEAIVVISSILACVVLAVIYLHVARQKYAVRMEIAAASSPTQARAGGLSALSSLAGISLGDEGSPQFREFLGLLRSPIAAEAILADQDLLKAIFPHEWSAGARKWREPPSHLRPLIVGLGSLLGWAPVPWSPPDVGRVYDYLNRELKIIPDSKSGVVTLELDSDRPDVARTILTKLNGAIDEYMRQHDLAHATTDIDYLTKRLSTVAVEDYRKALVSNLADQEKARMLASAPLPYASDVLGQPMVSSRPVSPKPLAVLAAAFVLGSILGLAWASIRYYRR